MATFAWHNLLIDDAHRVFTWGNNEYGQLGTGHKGNIAVPHLLPSFSKYKAIQVAVGTYHSLILTEDRNIWSFGRGKKGALGHNDYKDVLQPKRIESVAKHHIKHVSCGGYHNCVISNDDKVFTWGLNDVRQCGLGSNEDKISTPSELNEVAVGYSACGEYHTLLLTTKGLVLSCGYGCYGQLGHGDWQNQILPKIIEAISTKCMVHIACGWYHSLCIDKDGILYTWGDGADGRLGHNDTKQVNIPKVVEFFVHYKIKITSCDGGDEHSAAIASTGELFMFGNGYHGQLGLDEQANKCIPTKVDYFKDTPVDTVSLGSAYSTVITGGKVSGSEDRKETDEEEKQESSNENDGFVLKYDEEKNKNHGAQSYEMFIQNEHIFGHKDWVFMNAQGVSADEVLQRTSQFVDALRVVKKEHIVFDISER
eukprot:1121743_1